PGGRAGRTAGRLPDRPRRAVRLPDRLPARQHRPALRQRAAATEADRARVARARTGLAARRPGPAGGDRSRLILGAPLTRNRHGPQSVEVSDEAQATESGEQPPGLGFLVAVFEVLRPEIAIRGAVLQHVVDGSEDGGGDSDDRLPGSSPRPDAQELGVQVGGLGPGGRPGTLNEQGLEPRIALAGARRAALAGTLVAPRAEAGPGDQVTARREAAHVGADLGDDALAGELAHPGDGLHQAY